MELRHLRYFVAVAEEGSLTNAAERRLHTAQPSLSRQIRDLELEIGVKLLERKARGIALTAAGRVFLDHARLALMQIEVACEAARGTEKPEKLGFVIGFLLGQEAVWLPESLRNPTRRIPTRGIRTRIRRVGYGLQSARPQTFPPPYGQSRIRVAPLLHRHARLPVVRVPHTGASRRLPVHQQ